MADREEGYGKVGERLIVGSFSKEGMPLSFKRHRRVSSPSHWWLRKDWADLYFTPLHTTILRTEVVEHPETLDTARSGTGIKQEFAILTFPGTRIQFEWQAVCFA